MMHFRLGGMFLAITLALGAGSFATAEESILAMKRAAERGNVHAQTILGILYEQGEGVEQDYVKALRLFGKACDNGHESGCKNYQLLKDQGF